MESIRRWWRPATVSTLLAIALLGVLVRSITTTFAPLALLAPFAHLLLLAAPVAIVVAWRARWLSLVAVVVTVLGFVLEAPLLAGNHPPAKGEPVTVLTANLRFGLADANRLVARVRAEHADLLMVEEFTPAAAARLAAAGLLADLPFDVLHPDDGASGVGLYSRIPLLDPQVHEDGFEFPPVSGTLDRPGHPAVWAVHVRAPVDGPPTRWAGELRRLDALLQAARGPLIVGGDFNSTYDQARFRDVLHGGVDDAAEQCGAGFLPTYPADRAFPPLIGIDHVLVRGAVARTADSLTLSGSDHRAVVARLVLPA